MVVLGTDFLAGPKTLWDSFNIDSFLNFTQGQPNLFKAYYNKHSQIAFK